MSLDLGLRKYFADYSAQISEISGRNLINSKHRTVMVKQFL